MNRRQAGLIGCALLLSACAASPPPPPVLELTATGSAGQNPDPAGAPQPVSLHVFELASTQKFEQADVFALIEREQATLGPDLLGSTGLVLRPSATQQLKKELKPGTQAIGVVALFQKIDQAQWRASAPVAGKGTTRLTLEVGSLSVTLKPAGR
ncbi:type VI secretion system lipoprotein TssJ [Rhodopila sp.]|jgi:type VI secretion system protein VasD|uniref:type VI secretion system lipoprotein TssJ n=1 Tax=Rhodopila sp. TaxID=2480087 RepID=UPI002C4E3BD9|nr:type VI secretion system lipoprotein TssJ [Rhodopila sp.]HVZ09620.1 type VI secretion system lipoprotein TssJ [Rhodopila sp.]